MKRSVGLCLLLVLLGGCGGSDDRPDLEAARSTTDVSGVETSAPEAIESTTSAGLAAPEPLPAGQVATIAVRADEIAAAIAMWDDRIDACTGPSGAGDDAAATCTRAAWEQLFDQMDVAQYQLLRVLRPLPAGPCHESLSTVLDGVHGYLSGATPTKVVWLDEHQRPPSLFDLEAVVDLVRPAPAHLREAAATTCRG